MDSEVKPSSEEAVQDDSFQEETSMSREELEEELYLSLPRSVEPVPQNESEDASQPISSDESDDDFFDAKDDVVLEESFEGNQATKELPQESKITSEKPDAEQEVDVKDGTEIPTGEIENNVKKEETQPATDKKPGKTLVERKRNSDLWGNFEPDAIITVVKNAVGGTNVQVSTSSSPVVTAPTSVLSQPAQQVKSSWIVFEDDDGLSTRGSQSSGGGRDAGEGSTKADDTSSTHSKTEWVKFDESPRAKRKIMQQFTGSSSVYSGDVMSGDERSVTEMDRQSTVTSSAVSSHGSYTDSHEYIPLEISPSSSTGKIAEKQRWVSLEQKQFGGGDSKPAQAMPTFMSTPNSSPEKGSSSRSDTRSVSSPTPASWVKFEEEVLGAVSSSSSSLMSSPVRGPSEDVNPLEAQLGQMATLPSHTVLGEETHISQLATLQSNQVLHGNAGFGTTVPQGNSYLASAYSENSAGPVPPSPSPSNPFRQELMQQQQVQSTSNFHVGQGVGKSYNPFQSNVPEVSSQPTATWETFGDNGDPKGSPGNPFRAYTDVIVHKPFGVSLDSYATTRQSGSFDAPDASIPSTSVYGQPNDQFILSSDTRSPPLQRVVPTATVSPVQVTSSADSAACAEKEDDDVGTSTTGNGFVNEYPRHLEDPEQGWPLMLRFPDKKKLAGSREWKPVHVRLIEGSVLQFFNSADETDPFREVPLQLNYEFSPLGLQPYDSMGKIHTVKLLYASFKEKRKVSVISSYTRSLIVEQLLKLGSRDYENFCGFIYIVNEALMRLSAFKGSGSHYHHDSINVTVSDSYRSLLSTKGDVLKQSVHVDIYTLAFLSGKSECAVGLNDIQVKSAEVVSKRDIIPNKTNEWIKMEDVELHKCCNRNIFVESRLIRFDPVDACRFKLLSFDVRPKENPELPMLVKAVLSGEDVHMQFRVDLLVPARGPKQDPHHYVCYDIMVRIPLPESLISYFRRKKRIGLSSVKAVVKSADQIKKGSIKPNLLEVSIGSAKYEHAFQAIVWRIGKLPEKISAVPATHIFLCTLDLQCGKNYSAARAAIPSQFGQSVEVDYSTKHTTASHTTVRSLAVDSEKSPEKVVRYSAQYEYTVQVDNKYVMGPRADGVEDQQPECVQQ